MRRENFLSGPNFMYLIGHFQITFGLFFKASPGAHPFIWKLVFICMWMKTNFHMKGWAPGLAFKRRPKVIRQWPINGMFGLLSFETIIVPKSTESIQLFPFLGKHFSF